MSPEFVPGRIAVCVSSCGWTPFHDYYAGDTAGWTGERYMPRLRDVYGLDPNRVSFGFYEVVGALALGPFFSCSPEKDRNFEVAGVRKAMTRAREVYRLFGAGETHRPLSPNACGHDFPESVRLEASTARWNILHRRGIFLVAIEGRQDRGVPSNSTRAFRAVETPARRGKSPQPLKRFPIGPSGRSGTVASPGVSPVWRLHRYFPFPLPALVAPRRGRGGKEVSIMKREPETETRDSETQGVPGESSSRGFVRKGERAVGRLIALAIGGVFVIAGVGLSVTMVLLPIGIPLGVIGLVLIYGGACYGSVGSSKRE